MRKWLGIDPGASGGIGVIADEGHYAIKMPATMADLWEFLSQEAKSCDGQIFAVIERVHSMPKQGVASSFTFGEGYGALQMALTAAGIPFERVQPAKWQQVMACRTGGDKNVSKARAQELFPKLTITHATADALLIALYNKRTYQKP